MTFLENLHDAADLGSPHKFGNILSGQMNQVIGTSVPKDRQWDKERKRLDAVLKAPSKSTDEEVIAGLKTLAKLIDSLDAFRPISKGLQHVHEFIYGRLEALVFDQPINEEQLVMAAFLYGQTMAMTTLTSEAVKRAVEELARRGDARSANITLCILLGVERTSPTLFENCLEVLLQQIQIAAFGLKDKSATRQALQKAMSIYSPTEKASLCKIILRATHALLAASLEVCKHESVPASGSRNDNAAVRRAEGAAWACFIIERTPMSLRLDLRHAYSNTCDPQTIFSLLKKCFPPAGPSSLDHLTDGTATSSSANDNIGTTYSPLCAALPILTTWNTPQFISDGQVGEIVRFMLVLVGREDTVIQVNALHGLGRVSSVILDKFEPYLAETSSRALSLINSPPSPECLHAAQNLLRQLLASIGPLTSDIMFAYLDSPASTLLADVNLLEMIGTLIPGLSRRVVGILVGMIEGLLEGAEGDFRLEEVLKALNAFPLSNSHLAEKAQQLILFSLDEEKGQAVVMAALDLVTEPNIATGRQMKLLTFKAAQLLLADDATIVHYALNKLTNPSLASSLDERSCGMILLALHRSIQSSIQVVAAKLLTHLTTVHRAIVQPLAWSHIRQSFSLMDFLKKVDPERAIVEACIISNLLPVLPSRLHKKYVGPVRDLVLSGLHRTNSPHLMSLVFQGLANLAKYKPDPASSSSNSSSSRSNHSASGSGASGGGGGGGNGKSSGQWDTVKQNNLPLDLLEMAQDLPKEAQLAALGAVGSLLAVPDDGLDVYNLLRMVHEMFGRGIWRVDLDFKAPVAAIYGELGTVERNPVISRDARAAIIREEQIYNNRTVHLAQVAETRDRTGALSQTHINWLVTKILMGAMESSYTSRAVLSEDRILVLDVMTSLGILQPDSIPALIPELPSLIMRELAISLESKERQKDLSTMGAALQFLASALHICPYWLQQFWARSADIFADSIMEGQALPVLQGLQVVLDAIED